MVLRPPRGTKGPDITVRRVFVHSTARASAAEIARAKKLDRARDDLDRLTRGLGSRHCPDEAAVRDRLAVIGKTRRVAGYLTTTVGTDPGTGRPTLQWAYDQAVLKAESATDGWYALLTNLEPPARGRHSQCAAPLQRPRSIRTPVRQLQGPARSRPDVLAAQPASRSADHRDLPGLAGVLPGRTPSPRPDGTAATKIPGLYAARPAQPTGWLIFRCYGRTAAHPGRCGPASGSLGRPTLLQQQLLDVLDVDPLRPP